MKKVKLMERKLVPIAGAKYYIWEAQVDDGPVFRVGGEQCLKRPAKTKETKRTCKDAKRRGLELIKKLIVSGDVYKPDNFKNEPGHEFWVNFIEPIAICESDGYFKSLNTWDRTDFTFGFVQFSALHADGYFVRFFRELLKTALAAEYFPDLTLKEIKKVERIHQVVGGKLTPLETVRSSLPLRRYLKPATDKVEKREVENAARFVHWSDSPEHRKIQVKLVIETIRQKLQNSYVKLYPKLDGAKDKICLVVCDIHHHTRGGGDYRQKIKKVFDDYTAEEDIYKNLLEIGKKGYPERVRVLRENIDRLVTAGVLGKRKYNKEKGLFELI